ncbi:MAG: hypothetical protein IBX50_16025 [Marinospirillum sp.]|uniref:toprim domain-containing protein n=1 Tax=Marinospirillum sp. TaxID=2183934 RepID=UPI001A0DF1D7|nr:hypothetical protein [Marinospirillum sp.]MBE0508198.1 hypothetical protein [Marinospirillum sp.]
MPFSAQQILDQAFHRVCDLAEEVGIDAGALLQELPPSGFLLKGREVPVLEPRYRGTCNVLFYENRLPSGNTWPFLRFFTFKHGGMERRFNGLRWFREQQGWHSQALKKSGLSAKTNQQAVSHDERLAVWQQKRTQEAALRWQRFQRLQREYQQAACPNPAHPWLEQRLAGEATPDLLARSGLRQTHCQRFLLPIERGGQQVAFQEFITLPGHLSKKIYTAQEGALNGSVSWIAARADHQHWPSLMCEGFITGLTLALYWPGPIQIALSAHNLKLARAAYPQPIVLAHDQDVWKPQAGNVGLQAALDAFQPGDRLIAPRFSTDSASFMPTDFNDLLMHEGKQRLMQCLAEQLEDEQ